MPSHELNQMRIPVFLAALLLVASSAMAAETEIVGKSKAGQKFRFAYGFPKSPERIADFPLPPDAGAEPTLDSGVQVSGERTANQPGIFNESQCAMLSTKNALFISCASQPRNALSGLVYRYKGSNKAGDGMYSCVVGCSNNAPRKLLEVGIPSGC